MDSAERANRALSRETASPVRFGDWLGASTRLLWRLIGLIGSEEDPTRDEVNALPRAAHRHEGGPSLSAVASDCR
jgi:hypothetical protein